MSAEQQVAAALASASNEELLRVLNDRITGAKSLDGSDVQALGLFGGGPDGSRPRPIMDAIAAFLGSPQFQAILMQLLAKLLGGIAAPK